MAFRLFKKFSPWTKNRKVHNKTHARTLKAQRVSRGLKASWVAEKMGISKSHLSDLERGRRCWNDDLTQRFSDIVCPGLSGADNKQTTATSNNRNQNAKEAK